MSYLYWLSGLLAGGLVATGYFDSLTLGCIGIASYALPRCIEQLVSS